MKFHIISLGCSKNTADSEAIANTFAANGWGWAESPVDADLLLINTCGFIKDAKEESLTTVIEALKLKSKNHKQKTAVFGCLVKRYYKQIKNQIPEIDYLFAFLTPENLSFLCSLNSEAKVPSEPYHELKSRYFSPPHIGILKIAEGCSNRCSYCAIPEIRGPFYSRPEEEILKDAENLAKSGAVELSVVAQDITRYGTDSGANCQLPDLFKKLSQIKGIKWIRPHYLHPKGLSKQLVDDIFSIDKVLPYFDIPFQHISDRMLRLMNRKTSPTHIRQLVGHIRRNFRKSCIRTTFIVGFPGENKEDFKQILDFIELHPIDRVGAFAYSTEENTPASKIIPKVPAAIKQERLDKLMTLQQLVVEERNRKLINKKVEVIIDEVLADSVLGRTPWDSYEIDNLTTIEGTSDLDLKPGQIVKARIIEADAYDFKAELV
ncbi:MAG: 30S ribosomal protein S12 methylthiotransferase RimO [Candidatus Rifleibacteriota bacterium]